MEASSSNQSLQSSYVPYWCCKPDSENSNYCPPYCPPWNNSWGNDVNGYGEWCSPWEQNYNGWNWNNSNNSYNPCDPCNPCPTTNDRGKKIKILRLLGVGSMIIKYYFKNHCAFYDEFLTLFKGEPKSILNLYSDKVINNLYSKCITDVNLDKTHNTTTAIVEGYFNEASTVGGKSYDKMVYLTVAFGEDHMDVTDENFVKVLKSLKYKAKFEEFKTSVAALHRKMTSRTTPVVSTCEGGRKAYYTSNYQQPLSTNTGATQRSYYSGRSYAPYVRNYSGSNPYRTVQSRTNYYS